MNKKVKVEKMRMKQWMSGYINLNRFRNEFIREKVGVTSIHKNDGFIREKIGMTVKNDKSGWLMKMVLGSESK